MPVRLNSTGGGSVTLDVPATAGTFTVNLPAANGDVVVTGGGSTVQFGPGSVSAPSITFSGDTNTGIYSPAADTIAFTEGGVEGMRIDSAGNVGIGTSAPTARLDLGSIVHANPSTGITASLWTSGGDNYGIGVSAFQLNYISSTTAPNSHVWHSAGAERMRINGSGNVGIGTSSPASTLDVFRASEATQYVRTGSVQIYTQANDSTASGVFGTITAHPMRFITSAGERARITSGGMFLVGTSSSFGTTAAGALQVAASDVQLWLRHSSTASGQFWRFGPDNSNNIVVYNQNGVGAYILNGGTSWIANSDERLKTDLQPIEDAAQKVSTLRAVTGRFKTDEPGIRRVFLIAQDVQAVLPEAVSVQNDAQGTLGLAYTDVIPLLTAALQEALSRIETLEARLAAVEAR